jgi:very-short-patch-repair endonuclease
VGLQLRRQVDSGNDEAWTGRVDLRDARHPLIIEVQSEKYHSALLDVEADSRRRDALERAGFIVVEVTDVELWTAPAVARARVVDALASVRCEITPA